MLCAISKLYTMAPSHIMSNICCSSSQSVWQAEKLVNLEEMVGPGKAEDEPEGEVIAGLSREAVESSSSGTTSFFFFRIK